MSESITDILAIGIFQGFVDAWDYFVFVVTKGGWILFLYVLLLELFFKRLVKLQRAWGRKIEWVYLSISIPEMPVPTIMAAEQIFSQIHSLRKRYTWHEMWIHGIYDAEFSFEIVSLGGVIRFMIRTSRNYAEGVKTAVFAQYPNAEIKETDDYMKAFARHYNPEQADYDFYGTELMLAKMEAYPIKTFQMFEHRAAEIIMDPLAALFEVMANLDPDEMVAIQIPCQPDSDAWKEHAREEVKKLKGEPKGVVEERQPLSMMVHLAESEKNVINLMLTKLSKLSFKAKVRILYVAPKDKIKVTQRVPAILGAFAQFNASDLNSFQQNTFTYTYMDARFSNKYEESRIRRRVLWRKRIFLLNFIRRWSMDGGGRYHLSTEELATLFHFPLETVRTTTMEKTEAKKAEAPINLPV